MVRRQRGDPPRIHRRRLGPAALTVDKAIVCDDQMRERAIPTSTPSANASSIAARSTAWSTRSGEQARVLADVLTGPESRRPAYLGSRLGTKTQGHGRRNWRRWAKRSPRRPSGRKSSSIASRGGGSIRRSSSATTKVAGAILLGETDTAPQLMQLFMGGTKAPRTAAPTCLFAPGRGAPSMLQVLDMPRQPPDLQTATA